MSGASDGVSRLKLSEPKGTAPDGNAALGEPSIEDRIAEHDQLAYNETRIRELEKNNADLRKLVEQKKKLEGQAKAGGQGQARHVAHVEGWKAVCTAPDFCKVGGAVVAFNSFATLDKAHAASPNVKARGTPVYRKDDVVKEVQADAGEHIVSGTSLGKGYVKILDGHKNVKANGIPVARHDSRCLINCDANGVGGAQGKIVTEQKSVSSGGAALNPGAPPGERVSKQLQALKSARAYALANMVDINAADQYIDFREANQVLDGLIGQITADNGTAAGYAAQVARGLLGFSKDFVMGAGETLYEGVKAVPKLVQLTQTQSGQMLAQIDARILAENIKLGNITPDSVGQDALNIGTAMVKPVSDPWAKGHYVESATRGATEIGTLAIGWLKGSKVGQAAKLADAVKAAETDEAAVAARAAKTGEAVKPPVSVGGLADDGIHVLRAQKPKFSGDWKNYKTNGIFEDPMESTEGRTLVAGFENKGLTQRKAIREASRLMETGSTMPLPNPVEVGDKFYKVVSEGGAIGANSAFWTTGDQISALRGSTYDQIAARFGLPLASQQAAKFTVMEITAVRPGSIFSSLVAPTSEIGADGTVWVQSGGGTQSLLIDRSIFTQPKPTGIQFP